MILIISFIDNPHVHQVTQHLSRPFEVVDLAWFPQQMRMHAMVGPGVDLMYLDLPDGQRIDLDSVGAVWNRRISNYVLDPSLTDDTARAYAASESAEALPGLWEGMNCFWMNRPGSDPRALKKAWQHRLAHRVGLRVPETLVTNDPTSARAFAERHLATGVIRKAFRNLAAAPRETLRLGPAEMTQIDSIRYAPVILQEYIPLALDLRVTVIDGDIFSAAFRSEPQYEVDYRWGIGSAEVTPYTLPEDVAKPLLTMMTEMDLAFGAVDFRLTPGGEHVFFEINPAGEYLFVSDRTGQPIPAAIAATLERHDSARMR